MAVTSKKTDWLSRNQDVLVILSILAVISLLAFIFYSNAIGLPTNHQKIVIFSDSTWTFVIGSGITLISSLGAILVQSHVSQKEKFVERKLSLTEKLNTEIYSPMLFYLFEEGSSLGEFSGNLHGFTQVEPTKKAIDFIIGDFKRTIYLSKAKAINELLLHKIAYIEDVNFRHELFLYVQLLNEHEKCMKEFIETGFNAKLDKEIKWLRMFGIATLTLGTKTSLFIQAIDNLMSSTGKTSVNIFEKNEFAELDEVILSRNSILAES